jgi:hypothetical protein
MAFDHRAVSRRVTEHTPRIDALRDGPVVLNRALTLGPPLDPMAGHPDLEAAHLEWASSAGGAPVGRRRVVAGVRRRLLAVLMGPEWERHGRVLRDLTRLTDALAKRCDELNTKIHTTHEHLEEVLAALSTDLTAVAAIVADLSPALPEDRDASPPDG